jgi:hypothetical protein
MYSRIRLLPVLALAMLAIGRPGAAAPDTDPSEPEPGGKVGLERLLPEDSFFVTVIDLKAVRSSTLLTKHLKKDVEKVLELPPVARVLKQTGIDPLKDADRLIVGVGKSSFGEQYRDDGPFFLIQGRFNEKKVRSALEAMGKAVDAGKGKAYEVKGFLSPGESYFAVLNKTTVMWAPRKATIEATLSRVAPGKPATFKVRSFGQALKKIDGKQAIQAVGVEEMVFDTRHEFSKGKGAAKVTHITLGDKGIKQIHLSVSVKDTAKGAMVFTLKDQSKREEKEKLFKEGQAEIVRDGERAMKSEPQLRPLLEAIRKARIKTVNDQITIEAEADHEVFSTILKQILREGRP